MRLALVGATGRMGRSIVRVSHAAGDVVLVGAVCAPDDPGLGCDVGELAGIGPLGVLATADLDSGLLGAEMVIDFSVPALLPSLLRVAVRQGLPVVSGTTGLGPEAELALKEAARSIAVFWSPNTSPGIQVLAELLTLALRRLGSEYDLEIVEIHHGRKADSPSGTARRLSEAARSVRPELVEVCGRSGIGGPRASRELGLMAVRGGDVVGDHTVYLLGPGERIELVHRATSRELFAHGALRAARFLLGRAPGLYSMADVLG